MIIMILTFGSQLFQHCVNNDVGASSPNLMKLMMIFSFMIAIMVMMTLTKATGTTTPMTILTPALQWTTRGPSDSGQAPDDFLMKDSTCIMMMMMMITCFMMIMMIMMLIKIINHDYFPCSGNR